MELIEKVKLWGREKGITNLNTQLLRGYEEYAEVARLITRGNDNKEELAKEVGDVLVVTIILADILGLDPMDCLAKAHAKNEKRTGVTRDGNFIKAEDLEEGGMSPEEIVETFQDPAPMKIEEEMQ